MEAVEQRDQRVADDHRIGAVGNLDQRTIDVEEQADRRRIDRRSMRRVHRNILHIASRDDTRQRGISVRRRNERCVRRIGTGSSQGRSRRIATPSAGRCRRCQPGGISGGRGCACRHSAGRYSCVSRCMSPDAPLRIAEQQGRGIWLAPRARRSTLWHRSSISARRQQVLFAQQAQQALQDDEALLAGIDRHGRSSGAGALRPSRSPCFLTRYADCSGWQADPGRRGQSSPPPSDR